MWDLLWTNCGHDGEDKKVGKGISMGNFFFEILYQRPSDGRMKGLGAEPWNPHVFLEVSEFHVETGPGAGAAETGGRTREGAGGGNTQVPPLKEPRASQNSNEQI